jgi:hypothetical protein
MSDSSSSRASGSSPAGRTAGASPVDTSVTSDDSGSQVNGNTSSSAGVAAGSGAGGSTSSREYPDELRDRESRERIESDRHARFGGFNLGADFFGWLVAIALTVLLASIAGAVAAGLGSHFHVTQDDAEVEAAEPFVAVGLDALARLSVAELIRVVPRRGASARAWAGGDSGGARGAAVHLGAAVVGGDRRVDRGGPCGPACGG